MKNIFVLVNLVLFLFGGLNALYADPKSILDKKIDAMLDNKADFRNMNWGMTQKQVQSKERNKYAGMMGDNILIYEGKLNNIQCSIMYEFSDDYLIKGRYIFNKQFVNKSNFWDIYKNFKNLLSQRYGEPGTDDNKTWLNDAYKNSAQDKWLAISMGYMTITSQWQSDTSIITLFLHGENFETVMELSYEQAQQQEE